jgi:hypothetical protein
MPDPENTPASSVTFHHKKSGFFRVVHADGAWGSANQTGVINLALYSEHPSMPTSVTYPLDKDGNVINNPSHVGDEGFQREVEVSIALTVPAAMQVRATLDVFINQAVENMRLFQKQAAGALESTKTK